ncbi:18466_t:CDS:2, partial [Funneliformis geosporum]
MEALRVTFKPALYKDQVIPNLEVEYPKQFILPTINRNTLSGHGFNVKQFDDISDGHAKTFVEELNDVVISERSSLGMAESKTNNLVSNLLNRIIDFNEWPLSIRIHPLCELYLSEEKHLIAKPEFVISKQGFVRAVIIE